MYDGKGLIGAARQAVAIAVGALIFATTMPCGAFAAQHAGTSAAVPNGASQAAPPKLDALMLWLADPQVQAWLKQQHVGAAPQKTSKKPEASSV